MLGTLRSGGIFPQGQGAFVWGVLGVGMGLSNQVEGQGVGGNGRGDLGLQNSLGDSIGNSGWGCRGVVS